MSSFQSALALRRRLLFSPSTTSTHTHLRILSVNLPFLSCPLSPPLHRFWKVNDETNKLEEEASSLNDAAAECTDDDEQTMIQNRLAEIYERYAKMFG